MRRKIFVIILVFLCNIIWVNAINITNNFVSMNNILIVTKNKVGLNNNTVIDELDVLLETDLTYNNESAEIIGKKIDKTLKSEMEGKGDFIAKYAIVNEVDPYLIAAMIIEDTSCDYECSVLVKSCNNVSKMEYNKNNIGESACFGGNYRKFNSLEDGIKSFIKYVKEDFYKKEMKTPNEIRVSYDKDVAWVFRVNRYIERLKSNSSE